MTLHFHIPGKMYNPPAHSLYKIINFYLLTYRCKLFTHTHKTSDKYMGIKYVPNYFNVAPGKHMCWCYLFVNVVINLDVLCKERNF